MGTSNLQESDSTGRFGVINIESMEPILDKVARQKMVKKFFATIEVCDKSSNALPTVVLRHKRTVRFLCVVFLVESLVFFVFPFLMFCVWNFGDNDLPPFKPDTTFEQICDVTWITAALPLSVTILVCDKVKFDLPDNVAVITLLVVSPGIFWALIVELLLILKKRRWNQLQSHRSTVW